MLGFELTLVNRIVGRDLAQLFQVRVPIFHRLGRTPISKPPAQGAFATRQSLLELLAVRINPLMRVIHAPRTDSAAHRTAFLHPAGRSGGLPGLGV